MDETAQISGRPGNGGNHLTPEDSLKTVNSRSNASPSHKPSAVNWGMEKSAPTNSPRKQSSSPKKIRAGSKKSQTALKENPPSESKSPETTAPLAGSSAKRLTNESFPCLTAQELGMLTDSERLQLEQLMELSQLKMEQETSLDLASFAKAAWEVLEPGTPIVWNWHLDLLCEYLTLVRDRSIRRLIINVPPQTGKSRFVNVFFPCFCWATHPTRRYLSSSYSGDLSESFNRDRTRLIESEWYQRMFPGAVQLIRSTQQEIQNNVGGKMTATSTGGTATGKGAHDIIVDDPLNPQMAASELELGGANTFFDETLRSRLSDQVTGSVVIVMQRLDIQDLTGHVMKKEPGIWTHVKITMEAEDDEEFVFPISKRVVKRKAGDLLWPAKFPREVIETNLKIGMGSYVWAGQYQQRPTPRGGAIIKKHWLRYWNQATLPAEFDEIIQSWDLSFAKAAGSSAVSGLVIGRAGARKLLLDEVNARMEYTEARSAIRMMSSKWPQALAKLVENKANGPAVISDLRGEIPGLIAIEPDGDKPARMMAVAPEFESGCVELPDPSMPGYAWSAAFEEELLHFPQAPNDRGDAMSQGLRRLRVNVGGIIEYYKLLAATKVKEQDPSKREVLTPVQPPPSSTTYRTTQGFQR